MKNKKGIIDIFYIIAFMFALGVVIFAVFLMLSRIEDSGIYDGYDKAAQIHKLGENTILSMDNMMLFIIMGLSLFVIISAAFVWNHPVFMILGIVFLAIAITVAGFVSNTWFVFSTQAQIAEVTASFPRTNFLLIKLPFYILFMGIATLISTTVGFKKYA